MVAEAAGVFVVVADEDGAGLGHRILCLGRFGVQLHRSSALTDVVVELSGPDDGAALGHQGEKVAGAGLHRQARGRVGNSELDPAVLRAEGQAIVRIAAVEDMRHAVEVDCAAAGEIARKFVHCSTPDLWHGGSSADDATRRQEWRSVRWNGPLQWWRRRIAFVPRGRLGESPSLPPERESAGCDERATGLAEGGKPRGQAGECRSGRP
jgi:hypothetical protein